jgi:hypothetical protein
MISGDCLRVHTQADAEVIALCRRCRRICIVLHYPPPVRGRQPAFAHSSIGAESIVLK